MRSGCAGSRRRWLNPRAQQSEVLQQPIRQCRRAGRGRPLRPRPPGQVYRPAWQHDGDTRPIGSVRRTRAADRVPSHCGLGRPSIARWMEMLHGRHACHDRRAERGSSCPGSGTRRPSRRRVLHASVRDGRQRPVYSRQIRQSRRFPSDKFKGTSAALEVGAPEVPTKRWRSAWGDMEVTDSRCRRSIQRGPVVERSPPARAVPTQTG